MATPTFTRAQVQQRLGAERAALLFDIAARSERPLYLVGGVVRDWLLGVPGNELDLMLAGATLGDAIAFARSLQAERGGELRTHARFGTAQWHTAAGIATIEHVVVDFAQARRERYPRPGQLPRPEAGRAEEDLWRRDFSVNALALSLRPAAAFGRLLDPCGGLADLEGRRLRALHAASFRDDPTRFLRGLRLAARLGLRWDAETARWARESLPILARLSGSRLRAEFEQLFQEPRPEDALTAPEAAGLLPSLHAAFVTDSATLRERFTSLRAAPFHADPVAAGWRLLTLGSAPAAVADLAARFTLRKAERAGLERAAALYAARHTLADENRPPAETAAALEGSDEATRQALWVVGAGALRRQLERYESDWRWRRPALRGRDLRRLGLPPGPRYRALLERLQSARWNGEVTSVEEERALLARWLAGGGGP